jgi:hypothetical protein
MKFFPYFDRQCIRSTTKLVARLAETFYNSLPKHKIELVNGKTLISGSLELSRMVLDSILQSYGAQYI